MSAISRLCASLGMDDDLDDGLLGLLLGEDSQHLPSPACPHCARGLSLDELREVAAALGYGLSPRTPQTISLEPIHPIALRLIAANPGARIRPILAAASILGERHALLRHWGLVDGGAGRYVITPRGERWLAGELAIPESVTVIGSLVVEKSDRLVFVGEVGRD